MRDFQEKLSNISKSNISLSQEVNRLNLRCEELEDELRVNSDRHATLMDRVRQ
jgi:hypothetical protein